MAHAGQENGSLAAPYRQVTVYGITKRDIPNAIHELQAAGFIKRTSHGMRLAGGGEPSRFALTWLPTGMQSRTPEMPTHDWRRIHGEMIKAGIRTASAARTELKRRVASMPESRRCWPSPLPSEI